MLDFILCSSSVAQNYISDLIIQWGTLAIALIALFKDTIANFFSKTEIKGKITGFSYGLFDKEYPFRLPVDLEENYKSYYGWRYTFPVSFVCFGKDFFVSRIEGHIKFKNEDKWTKVILFFVKRESGTDNSILSVKKLEKIFFYYQTVDLLFETNKEYIKSEVAKIGFIKLTFFDFKNKSVSLVLDIEERNKGYFDLQFIERSSRQGQQTPNYFVTR